VTPEEGEESGINPTVTPEAEEESGLELTVTPEAGEEPGLTPTFSPVPGEEESAEQGSGEDEKNPEEESGGIIWVTPGGDDGINWITSGLPQE